MKITRRSSLIILLLALALLLAFLFRAFLLENFVRPVALIFWLVWRVLLSLDQSTYWSLLVFTSLVYGFFRLVQRALADSKPIPSPDSPFTLATVDYWRTFLLLAANEDFRVDRLKQDLVKMLATMYTSRTPETPLWEIYEALEKRRIPLPEHIYTFLFPVTAPAGRASFRQVLPALRRLPGKWLDRWSGRARARYYQSIEEVLTFMEASLEINHDDRNFDPHAR